MCIRDRFGRDRHPTNCACQQKRYEEKRLADQQRKYEDTIKELKKDCFDTPKLRDWCFAQDNGANPQMKHARFYADNFDTMLSEKDVYKRQPLLPPHQKQADTPQLHGG